MGMKEFIDRNRSLAIREGEIDLEFNQTSYKTDIRLYGFGRTGKRIYTSDWGETLFWQIEGTTNITIGKDIFKMQEDDILLIPKGETYEYAPNPTGIQLMCRMATNNQSLFRSYLLHGSVNDWHDAETGGFDNCNSKNEKTARKQGQSKKGMSKAELRQLAIEEEMAHD